VEALDAPLVDERLVAEDEPGQVHSQKAVASQHGRHAVGEHDRGDRHHRVQTIILQAQPVQQHSEPTPGHITE